MRFFGGGGTLLSRNDRGLGTTQHSQVESSQAEKISLRAFLSRREAKGTDEATSLVTLFAELRLGEGSTEIDNFQAKTNAQEPLYLQERGRGEVSTVIQPLIKSFRLLLQYHYLYHYSPKRITLYFYVSLVIVIIS